ncbi:Neurochondrin-domain-containing protein [Dissophora ornata]|nr:Neurochondrin-domain-containing protein [Dissophora ornata]
MSSSIADTKSALERCLELLKPGTSDESKFIGLTLMSDVLQSTQDLDTMTRFFESMDFGFLDRMMQIEDGSVPKDAGVDAAAIRSISIDIMTCFSIHWEVLVRKEFKDRVPTMVGMLSASDETDNSKKILKILVRISAYPQVSMVLTNAKYQSVIVSYILDTFDRKDEAHEDAILIYKRTFLIIQEGYKQNPSVVLNITKDFLPAVMTKFSKPFSTLAETHKPEILRLLAESIAYLSEAYVQQHAKEHPAVTLAWSRNLKSGLIQLLSTRQAPATRDDSFKLIGILLQRLGPEWIFPQVPSPSSPPSTSTGSKTSSQKKKSTPGTLLASMQTLSLSDVETEKKFAALVVHLTCVEVRVLMDQLADGLSSAGGKSNSVFETEDEAKQATVRKEQILPLTYEILEVSIGYLVRVSESEDSLEKGLFDATGVLKIQESLQGAFAAILDYLKDLQASSDASPQALASNMIYLASMRILSVWLMEDDSLHAQAASLVPPLEAVIRYCKTKSSLKSLLRLLEPIQERLHELSLD